VLTVGVLSVAGVAWAIQRGDPRFMFLGLPFVLMVWALLIPYRRIRAVDRTARPVAGMSMFGSQGVFGRFGTFWNVRLGFYRLYLTNRDAVVWLATEHGWIGLSPDRPDEFVERLTARTNLGG
jgi:hypothetical protein